MAKKNNDGYLSARESRRITRENRKITNVYEKQRKRKNVPESEYLTAMNDPGNSLEIENLHTYFFSDVGTVHAVDGISFEVPIGKTVGVVGESGCGKSVTSLSIMHAFACLTTLIELRSIRTIIIKNVINATCAPPMLKTSLTQK